MEQAEAFSAEGLLNTWFGGSANSAMESFRNVIGGALSQGFPGSLTTTKGKVPGRE